MTEADYTITLWDRAIVPIDDPAAAEPQQNNRLLDSQAAVTEFITASF